MQSVRLLVAMAVLGGALMIARAVAPHQINSIATYDVTGFLAIGIVACLIGIVRG